MKFSCTKSNLAQALGMVGGLANKSANLPILANILIKADLQKVELCATNLELAIITNVRSKIEKEGSFTVPARTLTEFINLMPEDRVDIEMAENELLINCGKSSTKIKGVSAEDFPVIPTVSEGKGYLVKAEDLKKGLSQIMPAVAKSDIRPELSGVFLGFNINGNNLVLAATDSYRLAEKKISLLQGNDELKIILPGRTAQEIMRMVSSVESVESEGEKNVRLLISDNQLVLNYDSMQMISRLVEGQYPDYTQIIPKEFKTTAEFSTNQMIKEIKAASLFTTAGVNSVSIDINVSQSSIGVSSTSTQTGEYSSEITSEASGEENSILLNHKYVLDGLANINNEVTILKAISADSPCLFIPKGDDSYLYIAMPIRQ